MSTMPCFAVIVASCICFVLAANGAESQELKLACEGKSFVKHYKEEKAAQVVLHVDLNNKSVLLSEPKMVISVTEAGKLGETHYKTAQKKFSVTGLDNDFIFIRKDGTVNDGAIVVNRDKSGKLKDVKVLPNDHAIGFVNRVSLAAHIQTAYYDTREAGDVDGAAIWKRIVKAIDTLLAKERGDQYEYGWAYNLQCRLATSQF